MSEQNKRNKNLFQDLQKARLKNEMRTSTIKGVKNLSRSDLDTIEFYAETIERTGSYRGLMAPRGGVKEVLMKYGFLVSEED